MRAPEQVLTVVSVAYPFAAVGPDAVGGAEQVLSAIDHALVAAGHRSVVIACAGSRCAGELRDIPVPAGEIDDTARAAAHASVRARLAEPTGADVVHLHGIDFAAYLPPPGPPALATLHLPLAWYGADALAPARPDTWLVCVSESQHRSAASPHLLQPVHNGVPVDELGSARHARRGFALTLGRICPEKGQHLALQAAHRADVSLLIAGDVFPYAAHQAYLKQQVRPLLDRRRRWIGAVAFSRKRRLLGAARCLLVPSLAAETSSLVAMEAAACGTPVIALRAGALPEIVVDGVTGFIVDDLAGMAAAIALAERIDPEACRAEARRRFGVGRMTAAYLDLYDRLAA